MKTLEELRAEYPEQIAQAEAAARAAVDHTEAVNAAVQAERERMQSIDEIASLLDDSAVQEAKYGDKPRTAAELLMDAAKAAAKQGKKFLADLKGDADERKAWALLRRPKRKKPMRKTRRRRRGWRLQEPISLLCSAIRRAKL